MRNFHALNFACVVTYNCSSKNVGKSRLKLIFYIIYIIYDYIIFVIDGITFVLRRTNILYFFFSGCWQREHKIGAVSKKLDTTVKFHCSCDTSVILEFHIGVGL